MKHTGGNWTIDENSDMTRTVIKSDIHIEGESIAMIYPNAEEIPNAKLMVASPKYLEALETIRDAFWSEGEKPEEQVIDLKSIAQQAIKNAS